MKEVVDIINQGCIDIWIDGLVPCLKDNETGELKETVVFKIESRAYLKNFKISGGWHINWDEIPSDVEVYALSLKEDNSIQGIIGIRKDLDAHAVYLHWACTAPHNNIHDFGSQRYAGVGGHLFAIAADKSVKWGFEGAMYGFAASRELLEHYQEVFNAEHIPMLHQYEFFIDEVNAAKILEVYTYEWN